MRCKYCKRKLWDGGVVGHWGLRAYYDDRESGPYYCGEESPGNSSPEYFHTPQTEVEIINETLAKYE